MTSADANEYWGLKFIRNHQTTFIDNTLWIDGGEVLPPRVANFSNSTIDRQYRPNTRLYSLDLSSPIIAGGDNANNKIDDLWAEGRIRLIEKPSSTLTSSGGALYNYLWADPRGGTQRFVQFGGRTSNGVEPEDPLSEYNAQSADFGDLKVKSKDVIQGGNLNPHHGAAAQSPDGIAYYLGGMGEGGRYLKQLVKLDLNSGDISVEDTGDMPGIVGSQMSWYPVGKKGILVSIGGEMLDTSGRIRSMPMETIWVYDILSSKWYSQVSTPADDTQGIPIDRKFFCAVSPTYTESQDSYEIILHGGHRTITDDFFKLDDVWALTVPTFQWIQYYYGRTGSRDTYGAYNVSCAIPNDRYFMVVSTYGFGEEFANEPFAWYDLFNLGWSSYDSNAKGYQRPQIVRSTVGRRREPDTWDSPALQEVFAQSYTRGYIAPSATTSSGGSPATGNPTGTPDPNSNGSGSKTNTAAIAAGASVGSIVFIALLVGLFFFIRRRKRKNLPEVPGLAEAPPPPPSGPGELPSPYSQPPAELPPQGQFVEADGHYMPVKPEYQQAPPVEVMQLPSAPNER